MCRLVAAPVVEPCCFGGTGRALFVCLRVASRDVFCSFVWGRTDWLAAGRGSYLPPSLPTVSRDALSQLLVVCIILYKIRPPRFKHNTYCFIHIAWDDCNVILVVPMHHLFLSLFLFLFPSPPLISLLSNVVSIYRMSDPMTLVIIIHAPSLSLCLTFHLFFCFYLLSISNLFLSSCFFLSITLLFHTLPLSLFWSRADRNRKALNFPREPPIGFLLTFLSSSISNSIYSY